MDGIKRALSACVAVLVAGCAASGPKFADVEASMPALRLGEGRIFLYRENTPVGAALRPDVALDGQAVGALQVGSFMFFDRPAGRHAVSSRTEAETRVEFELAEGESVYIGMTIGMGFVAGRPQLTLQAPLAGAAAVRSLAYAGPVPVVPGPSRAAAAPAGAQPAKPPAGSPPAQRSRSGVTLDDLNGLLPAR